MTTLNERLNSNTPIQKRRGRPAKVLEATDLNHRNNEASEIKERKMVGKPNPLQHHQLKLMEARQSLALSPQAIHLNQLEPQQPNQIR